MIESLSDVWKMFDSQERVYLVYICLEEFEVLKNMYTDSQIKLAENFWKPHHFNLAFPIFLLKNWLGKGNDHLQH